MKKNYEIYGENADRHANRTKISNLSSEFENMLKRFNSKTKKQPIIDIGCAVGRDVRYLNSVLGRESQIYGVDASEKMICKARQNTNEGSVNYLVSDMRHTPFREDFFGGAWCQATIFMVERPQMELTLKEINRILKTDGLAVVSFKISDDESSENGRQVRERWDEKIHYHFVDQDIATKIVLESGMSISNIEKSSFGNTVFLNYWIRNK